MGGITGEPWARLPAVQTTAETTPETLHHQGSRGELTPETRSLAIMCPRVHTRTHDKQEGTKTTASCQEARKCDGDWSTRL